MTPCMHITSSAAELRGYYTFDGKMPIAMVRLDYCYLLPLPPFEDGKFREAVLVLRAPVDE